MKRFLKKSLIALFIFVYIFSGFPVFSLKVKKAEAAEIQQYSGGLVVYADTVDVGTPKYKTFDDTTGFGSEQSASSVGSNAIEWLRVAASPVNDEWIITTRDNTDVLKAQVCTGVDGGVSCGSPTTISATAGTVGMKNWDLEYEQSSGDALLVYGTNTADELRKIEWTGGSWTNDAAITTTNTTGSVEWVELTARPGSDQIGIAYADSNADVSAYRWSGSAVGNEATAVINASAVTQNLRKFDISFEGSSGDMLVISPQNAVDTLAYGHLSGSTWTIGTETAVDDTAAFADLPEPPPSGDDLAIFVHDKLTGGTNVYEGFEWDGSAFVDGAVADQTGGTNWFQQYVLGSVAYLSSTYVGVATYSDQDERINWWTMDSSGVWTAQADNLRTRSTFATRTQRLYKYPAAEKVLLLLNDPSSDLWADTWDGTSVGSTAWTDITSGGAIETDLPNIIRDTYDFAFRLAPNGGGGGGGGTQRIVRLFEGFRLTIGSGKLIIMQEP